MDTASSFSAPTGHLRHSGDWALMFDSLICLRTNQTLRRVCNRMVLIQISPGDMPQQHSHWLPDITPPRARAKSQASKHASMQACDGKFKVVITADARSVADYSSVWEPLAYGIRFAVTFDSNHRGGCRRRRHDNIVTSTVRTANIRDSILHPDCIHYRGEANCVDN